MAKCHNSCCRRGHSMQSVSRIGLTLLALVLSWSGRFELRVGRLASVWYAIPVAILPQVSGRASGSSDVEMLPMLFY